MAGGFGTRIQPLTHSRPKPMLPIVNKPMMEHTMLALRDLGITEFIVLLYFKPDIIKEHFKDGSHLGINITYVLPDDDYGTAGAVRLAKKHIGDDNFIIISGDLVTDFDFRKIFSFHRNKDSKLTIGLTSVENPLQFGVVIADEEGRIEKFLEKPSWGEVFSDTINTGIYIIEPEILDYIPEGENFDFAKDLFPLLMTKGIDLMGYNLEGYWRDVGNPESYREVYEDIMHERVAFTFEGEVTHYPDGLLYSPEPVTLDKSVEIVGKVVLGKRVVIGKGTILNNVVIGDDVVIGAECKIRNSVFWEDVRIGRNVKLDNCVICSHNIIEKNVQAKAGLILAEGCEVGQLARFEHDIVVWPDKVIDDAAIVSHNVVWGSKYKNSIFENGSVVGRSNVELSCEMVTKMAEAFGSQLPAGCTVYVSRDLSRSSRMLKRAFLGGLLSAGINVIDLQNAPMMLMRYNLANHPEITAGVHFRQYLYDPTSTEVLFFDEYALRLKSDTTKSIERAFFTEKFRRVEYARIGAILDQRNAYECVSYKEAVIANIDTALLTRKEFRVVIDLMHGSLSNVYPEILKMIGIENITLNANHEEEQQGNETVIKARSVEDVSSIVRSLSLPMGFIIYPNAHKLMLVTDKGNLLEKEMALLAVLYLINLDAAERQYKVFLPAWAPDFMDDQFENLVIERGKYANFNADKMRAYDMIATVDGNFAFTAFALHRDATYSSLKIMELLLKHEIMLSEIVSKIDMFYYHSMQVPCTQALKGKMMRKFLEDAKGNHSNTVDGVKIWTDSNDWILMIPDQYSDNLNLYIQAMDKKRGNAICDEYQEKIAKWAEA
jgi:mannose-1-phosphate guanylyltransferase/phosphomannomutase